MMHGKKNSGDPCDFCGEPIGAKVYVQDPYDICQTCIDAGRRWPINSRPKRKPVVFVETESELPKTMERSCTKCRRVSTFTRKINHSAKSAVYVCGTRFCDNIIIVSTEPTSEIVFPEREIEGDWEKRLAHGHCRNMHGLVLVGRG